MLAWMCVIMSTGCFGDLFMSIHAAATYLTCTQLRIYT